MPQIIKGCPRDKWEEVQAIQHEPFVYIKSNGSRWLGDEEGDIPELLEVLRTWKLDSRMFHHGFITVNPCQGIPDPHAHGKYIDGPRLYSCEGVHSFFGNFVEVSHVFSIDTNDAETIAALTSAIEANAGKLITYRVELSEGKYHRFDYSDRTADLVKAREAFESHPIATLEELSDGAYLHTLDQSCNGKEQA